jgi:mRNA interferase MazF
MVVERGSIWWADLGDPVGSAPGFRRPVLVVQSDLYNASAIKTVIVATMTSNTSLAEFPGNVLLPADQFNLPKDSVVNVSQLTRVDISKLESLIGNVDEITMRKISAGLRLVLDL